MEELEINVNLLKESLTGIDSRRTAWNNGVRDFIENILKVIVNKYDLNWSVGINEQVKNMESVSIYFHQGYSGHIIDTGDKKKALIKKGAALVFSQVYNGEIFVTMYFPHIDDVTTTTYPETIGRESPVSITEEYIYKMVNIFLSKLNEWENK